jgi:multiple sugar transport system permease protein
VKQSSGGYNMKRQQALAGYLFAGPVILGFLIWVLGPMIATILMSLTDWPVIGKAQWVGFQNYVTLFTSDPFFYQSIKVTLNFGIVSVVIRMIYSLAIALLLNQRVVCKGVFRTIFYLPSIIPIVATSMIWVWCYQPDFGLFNMVLKQLGLPASKWLYATETVIPSLILVDIWCASNTIIIFLDGLQGVPKELLEAVEVDGGGWFRKFTAVTMPHMTPFIFLNMILGFIGNFQAFTQAFVMTKGGPNNASLFTMLLIYREAFQNAKMGYACAISWVLFLITGAFTMLIFRTAKSWVYYTGDAK